MTEEQVKRANDLVFARETIEEFLTARDPVSEFVKTYLNSKYEHQRREGKLLPTAHVAEIQIMDARSCQTAEDEDADTLASWFIPRDILERALQGQLAEIAAELKALGVS